MNFRRPLKTNPKLLALYARHCQSYQVSFEILRLKPTNEVEIVETWRKNDPDLKIDGKVDLADATSALKSYVDAVNTHSSTL